MQNTAKPTMPFCFFSVSRMAPLGTPLPLLPLPLLEATASSSAPAASTSTTAAPAAAAAAPLLLLLLLVAPVPAGSPAATPAAPVSSWAFQAPAAAEGTLSERGTRPKVCWISSLVCCTEQGSTACTAGTVASQPKVCWISSLVCC